MNKIKNELKQLAEKYDIQIIYAFGSRAKEALNLVEGKIERLSKGVSDLDIGIKPRRRLNVEEKVEIALALEEIFDVKRVDLVIIPEAPIFLALEIVKGELLYAKDLTYEAEYQLYIMRQAAELIHYERMKQKMILGF
ncbi:MAG: nucleotidyltransferase domain-containing protein [Candidatus Desulfofervidus auxilii]|nr:nucleotidyltransferase domain-containing protein [Candidatus Desulfofervidus auxilii]